MTKKEKAFLRQRRIYDPVCHCSGCECNAHYGGVSSGGILCDMGHYLSAVSCGRIDFPEKKSKRKSKDDHADRHVRRVYFRDLVFKDPVVTGSCSHMTGTGLGAILLGPAAVSVLGIIVLLFQAILLAHGGLTTLGANTFSMAIAGPLVSFGLYKLCEKCKWNRKYRYFSPHF